MSTCVNELVRSNPAMPTDKTPSLIGDDFVEQIHTLVKEHDLSYMDAVVFWCDHNNIEVDVGAELVAKKTVVNALFIFDDMISEGIMNSHKMGTLESIAVRGRHANVSIVIITQQYMALSPAVRNNSTNSIFFRIRNGDELDKIARENRESLSPDQFMELYNFATRDPYSFLHVNNQESDPSKRFFKNWDTSLLLKNDEKEGTAPKSVEKA